MPFWPFWSTGGVMKWNPEGHERKQIIYLFFCNPGSSRNPKLFCWHYKGYSKNSTWHLATVRSMAKSYQLNFMDPSLIRQSSKFMLQPLKQGKRQSMSFTMNLKIRNRQNVQARNGACDLRPKCQSWKYEGGKCNWIVWIKKLKWSRGPTSFRHPDNLFITDTVFKQLKGHRYTKTSPDGST